MKADDPVALDVMQRSMVARIGTCSCSARPSITPLYFVPVCGHIWLGTVNWTLAARHAKADPRVSVQVEQDPGERRVLRISGRASVRADRKGLFAIKRGERPRSLAVRMSLPRGEAAQ
jgi:general stress protein 26